MRHRTFPTTAVPQPEPHQTTHSGLRGTGLRPQHPPRKGEGVADHELRRLPLWAGRTVGRGDSGAMAGGAQGMGRPIPSPWWCPFPGGRRQRTCWRGTRGQEARREKQRLGQQFVNRQPTPGADRHIGRCGRSPRRRPDGHTILFATPDDRAQPAHVEETLSFEPAAGFRGDRAESQSRAAHIYVGNKDSRGKGALGRGFVAASQRPSGARSTGRHSGEVAPRAYLVAAAVGSRRAPTKMTDGAYRGGGPLDDRHDWRGQNSRQSGRRPDFSSQVAALVLGALRFSRAAVTSRSLAATVPDGRTCT